MWESHRIASARPGAFPAAAPEMEQAMSYLSNRATVLLLCAVAVAIALASSGCKNRTPPEPASPPKPKLESHAVEPFAHLQAMPTPERITQSSARSRGDTTS
jgi:hypothetical protein